MASGESDTQSPLVGICLCGETWARQGQVIQTVCVPPPSRIQHLTHFRGKISRPFLSIYPNRKFVFLSAQGWEINQNQEHVLKLSDVITKENTVNVRICHPRSRIGIQIQDCPDAAVGFVFCDSSSTVAELTKELSTQLPELYKCLLCRKFCFLDRNGWPITEGQEHLLCVMEISFSSCVKLCLNHSITQHRARDSQTKIPMIENDQVDSPADLTEKNRFSLQDSLTRHFTRGHLPPLDEDSESAEPSWPLSNYAELKVSALEIESFEIILSYVHTEAGKYALLLKEALKTMGYTVFLDIHCIEGGTDWQDVLNNAISDCSLFVPLITMRYGQTLWTNREVKLADVLGKLILPVNFNQTWPPKCLAIQFATTQFIPGNKSLESQEVTPENFTESIATIIATDIVERYSKDKSADVGHVVFDSPLLSREESTADSTSTPNGLNIPALCNLSRRSTIRSYASDLPQSVSKIYQKAIFESRKGKPLVVLSCCQKQKDFSHTLGVQVEEKGYEVWCSCDIADENNEDKSFIFQEKVNEAGVVIFVLSKDFANDEFCEQQVYYCEQRKRIIPLIYEPFEMPNWMATLIGTSTFINYSSQSYVTALMDRIETFLNPSKAENEIKQVLRQKIELANLCIELEEKLPEGKYVYISGGTQFFSKCGKAICQEVGKELARDERIVLITGGFYGVGETVGRSFYDERERMGVSHKVCHVVAVKDEQDKSSQTRQNPDLTFPKVPYGDTFFFGNSVRHREMLTPKVIDLCILIEGGPGAAFEAQQFIWNGNIVIPVSVTGGAASGLFNVPSSIFVRPSIVSESDWSVLGDKCASSSKVGVAVAQIIATLTNPKSQMSVSPQSIADGGGTREWMVSSAIRSRLRSDNSSAVMRKERERKMALTLNVVRRASSEKHMHVNHE